MSKCKHISDQWNFSYIVLWTRRITLCRLVLFIIHAVKSLIVCATSSNIDIRLCSVGCIKCAVTNHFNVLIHSIV